MQFFTLLLMVSFSLTGCFGQKTPVEKMFTVMENVVDEEKGFEEQQKPLVELEQKEKDLYEKIISLGSKENDQIVKLSDEAISVVLEREKHMEKEQKSLIASKKKFETISPFITKLDDSDLKNRANDLYELMNKRYEIHDLLYENYMLGTQYDIELYKMLKDKEASMEQLDNQVTKINETYDKVLKANEEFNQQTKKYNETKLNFYKKAGIKVSEAK
ncbi:MAG: chromosome partitioning protein [Bacillus sp. (in: firmicutes)]|nr:chromosome partitioning protein [Bacillus sp. (in: firmicutes)]